MANESDRNPMPGALAPGSKLGRYQVISRIAVGGMAELYLARQVADAGYEKIVALKRVLPHLAQDAEFLRMFLDEARFAAALDHANIVHVIDFGSDRGEHFLVMEYIHGHSVQQLLRKTAGAEAIPRAVALTIVHEIAAALHYAHERAGPDGRPLGLVHRDVSPSNILVSQDGDVKLVDFGIAKATAHTRVTRSGTIKGKLSYMAPEQVRAEALDRRADVFALTVVAYELLTGRRCFTAPAEFALINRVAAAKYKFARAVDPSIPEELDLLLRKGLSIDREDRFATAREFQVAIEEFAESAGHRLSRLALSEFVVGTFGGAAYPTSVGLPAPDVIPTPTRAVTLRTPRGRVTSAALLVVAVGVGLGIGRSGSWFSDEGDSRPNIPSSRVQPPQPQVSQTASVQLPSPAQERPEPEPAAPVTPLNEEESVPMTDALENAPAPATPAARREPRAPPRRKRRRTPPRPLKPAADEPALVAPTRSGTQEYLPPSRRSGS